METSYRFLFAAYDAHERVWRIIAAQPLGNHPLPFSFATREQADMAISGAVYVDPNAQWR